MKRALVLAVLTLSAYAPSLSGGFLWDDDHLPLNPVLSQPDALRRIWTPGEVEQYYPATFTSFWLERKLWGTDPAGYRAVNLALHLANAGLAWLVLALLGAAHAWWAAALFALHPVHAESAAWIAERKNLLSAFFSLLSLAANLRYEERGRPRWYGLSLGAFALALLSKTTACTLPAVFLLLRWARGLRIGRPQVREILPFLALGVPLGLQTAWLEVTLARASGAQFEDVGGAARLIIAGKAAWFYLGKLAWPAGLSFNYERWTPSPWDIAQWLWPASMLATAGAALRWRRRWPAAALLFFLGTLAPALGFFKIYPQRYSFVADHFQYLASLGPLALAASLLGRKALAAGAVLGLLWVGTWRRAHAFHDQEALWRDTLSKNPGSFLAHQNLGTLLAAAGRRAEAMAHYRAAIAANPLLPEAHNGLGTALLQERDAAGAEAEYRRALEIKPDYASARNNLGLALGAQGRWAEAVAEYEAALRLDPSREGIRKNLERARSSASRARGRAP